MPLGDGGSAEGMSSWRSSGSRVAPHRGARASSTPEETRPVGAAGAPRAGGGEGLAVAELPWRHPASVRRVEPGREKDSSAR